MAFIPELCGEGEKCLGEKGQREVVGLGMRESRARTGVCWWLNGSRAAAGGAARRPGSSQHQEGFSDTFGHFNLAFWALEAKSLLSRGGVCTWGVGDTKQPYQLGDVSQ